MYEKSVPEISDYVFGEVVMKVRSGELSVSGMEEQLEKLLDDEAGKFGVKLWRMIILYSKKAAAATGEI